MDVAAYRLKKARGWLGGPPPPKKEARKRRGNLASSTLFRENHPLRRDKGKERHKPPVSFNPLQSA